MVIYTKILRKINNAVIIYMQIKGEMKKMADIYVQNVQRWVNNKFRGYSGYTVIPENGETGWTTIYALLHGLQITLEVGSTADNFGNGTINAFNAFVNKN